MNDSAMQLMTRERREQFLSSGMDRGSDLEARPLLRTALGLMSGLVCAILVATIALVINVRTSMPWIAHSATQAGAPERTAQTTRSNEQEKLAKNSDLREAIYSAADAERTISKVER